MSAVPWWLRWLSLLSISPRGQRTISGFSHDCTWQGRYTPRWIYSHPYISGRRLHYRSRHNSDAPTLWHLWTRSSPSGSLREGIRIMTAHLHPNYLYLILLALQEKKNHLLFNNVRPLPGLVPRSLFYSLTSTIHYPRSRKGNMNTECFRNPEVAGCFSTVPLRSADWCVARSRVSIKGELIRLIDSGHMVLPMYLI